jgi:hypothetical protein
LTYRQSEANPDVVLLSPGSEQNRRPPQEWYAVDVAIPDSSLMGGFDYDNVTLLPEQFRVVSAQPR